MGYRYIQEKMMVFRREKYSIIFILSVFLVLTVFSWNKWGDLIFFDNTRELMVSLLISKGNCLYADIHYFYGPLMPYFVSLLVSILGFKLSVFYFTGLFLTLVYCFILYGLARMYMCKLNSMIVSVLFLIQLAFFNTLAFSYILPYSYNAVLGGLLVVLSIIFLLKHFNSSRKIFLFLAATCCTINLLVKQDFFGACFASFMFYFILVPLRNISFSQEVCLTSKLKTYIKNLMITDLLLLTLFIFSVPAVIYSIFSTRIGWHHLIQELLPEDLCTLNNPYTRIFVNDYLKATATWDNTINFFFNAIGSAVIILMCIAILYCLITIYKKYNFKKLVIVILSCILFLILTLLLLSRCNIIDASLIVKAIYGLKFIYSGINLWLIILLFYCLLNIGNDTRFKLALLIFAAIMTNFRMFFNLELELYSFYYLPLSLIVFVYTLTTIVPDYLKKFKSINSNSLKLAVTLFLFTLVLIYLPVVLAMYNLKNVQITTGFGKTYTRQTKLAEFKTLQKAANYIKANTSKDDNILVYPKHMIIYLLSDRLPASMYYFLIEGSVDPEIAEPQVISDIKKRKPPFIVLTNDKFKRIRLKNGQYKTCKFGDTFYYPRVFKYIKDNYVVVKTFSADVRKDYLWRIDIYKIKKT